MDLNWLWIGGGSVLGLAVLTFFAVQLTGFVSIAENQVGVLVKKFGGASLPAGSLIALHGEAGYQAEVMSPGWYFGYWSWQYQVTKTPLTKIQSGQIGLVMANDGVQISSERILGKVVDSDNFQNARKFLENKGEKGRQLGVLTAGTYRINTALFTIITAENANKYGLDSSDLQVFRVPTEAVGVVTTLDGKPIPAGEIAGAPVTGHENFQNGQAFVTNGGFRGLQEQVLLSGSWNINPWFAKVEMTKMTEVPIGSVGVVMSYVGKEHKDISGDEFKHGDLVEVGHKGVWAEPLYPGRHPLNPNTTRIELVPTTNLALNWMDGYAEAHGLDKGLESISIRSKDGFPWKIEVTQVIHIGAKDASKVISRFGTMKNLVDQVLEPAIGNYFRNSAQNFTVLDFLSSREARQKDALSYIREALTEYNIETVDTYIGDMSPPEELIKTQTDKKIAEEQKETYKAQESTAKQRQTLAREQAMADTQAQVVQKEQEVKMQEFSAQATIKKAEGEATSIKLKAAADSEAAKLQGIGEAEAIRAKGKAQAEAYDAGAKAMGSEVFGRIQIVNAIGDKHIKVTPDTLITSGQGGSGEGTNGLMMTAVLADAVMEHRRGKQQIAATTTTAPTVTP